MKIAVTGKGGVGKTTFAATLARLYAEEGRHVLAADVDPDANLGLALGFSEEELDTMVEYDKIMPEYGFASHKGYGSKSHIEAIQKYGPSPIHRATFIKNFL